jgi:hypothetical protein
MSRPGVSALFARGLLRLLDPPPEGHYVARFYRLLPNV